MKTQDVLKHFGSQTETAKALGIKQPSVATWGEYPPHDRQIQIQAITNGALRAEHEAVVSAIDSLLGTVKKAA